MKFKCNCCDGIYNSFDVHFTSLCDNKCAHCVDTCYEGKHIYKPDIENIANTIINNSEGYDDVLFLGGEPCLFLNELIECIKMIQVKTDLKVYVTTSVPYVCYKERDKFISLIEMIDGINLSVQHYKEDVADEIRKVKSAYNRQEFYDSLPHKEKIRINLNIVKPYLYAKEDLTNCLSHYDRMGFNSIKLSEIQHGKDYYVSFEKVFGIHLGSAYANGCQTWLDTDKIIPGMKTPILLKRSCFACEETLNAGFSDMVKAVYKIFNKPNNKYGVVYEDGTLEKGWV